MYNRANTSPDSIVLVDDHVLVSEGFRGLLLRMQPQDYLIDVFSTVDAAAATLKAMRYQIRITDLVIPGQNVISFITACRDRYQ